MGLCCSAAGYSDNTLAGCCAIGRGLVAPEHILTQLSLKDTEVQAKIWLGVGSPGFIFPELRGDEDGVASLLAKQDFAIGLSGGGMRACCQVLGWVRALHHLGILQQARYVSACSFGASFLGPFSYQKVVPTEEFLGQCARPEELTLEFLVSSLKHESFGKALAESSSKVGIYLREIGDNWCKKLCHSKNEALWAWDEMVAECFLAKYSLGDFSVPFALEGRTENLKAAGLTRVNTLREDVPFPIFALCVAYPEDSQGMPFRSFESTPLYTGAPMDYQPDAKVGAVLVETFAAFSDPPKREEIPAAAKATQVHLKAEYAMPLARALGISAAILANNFVGNKPVFDLAECPVAKCWDGLHFQGGARPFADGGGTDVLALLPLLRRGVKKIALFWSADEAPSLQPSMASNWSMLMSYFAAIPEGWTVNWGPVVIPAVALNKQVQVFETAEFAPLLKALVDCEVQKKPIVARTQLKVLPNKVEGVAGDYTVDIVWVLTGGAAGWTEKLPAETRDYVEKTIPSFPYFNFSVLNYSPELVSLENQQASWVVHEVQQTLLDFLAT